MQRSGTVRAYGVSLPGQALRLSKAAQEQAGLTDTALEV